MGSTGFLQRGVFSAVALCAVFTASAVAADQPLNKAQILEKARARYYSLRVEGLAEFSCSVVPNWNLALAEVRQKNPKEADRELKILRASHFRVAVPAYGDVAIVPAPTAEGRAEQDERSAVVYRNMQNMTQSFFQTWQVFVRDPFLPRPGAEYTLEEEPSQYRFTFHDGTVDVEAVTDREMLIKSGRISGETFATVFRPEFRKVAGRFLLSGYDLSYPGLAPDSVGIRTVLDYQLVDGFQLPGRLTVTATGGGESYMFEFSFVDCHASRRGDMAPAGAKR